MEKNKQLDLEFVTPKTKKRRYVTIPPKNIIYTEIVLYYCVSNLHWTGEFPVKSRPITH